MILGIVIKKMRRTECVDVLGRFTLEASNFLVQWPLKGIGEWFERVRGGTDKLPIFALLTGKTRKRTNKV